MTEREGPLAGILVVDLTTIVAGPMVGQILCDMGAKVIKIETVAFPGDGYRMAGSIKAKLHGRESVEPMGGAYYSLNRGKRCIAVDMKRPDGYEIFRKLLQKADVLTMNMRPQAAQHLRITYEHCKKINPNLIYLSSTGWGSDGPFSKMKAYDPVVQATAGIVASQARPTRQGGPVVQTVNSIVMEKATAMSSVQAILAALFARSQGKGGQKIDISMLSAGLAFNFPDLFADKVFRDQKNAYYQHEGIIPEMFGTATSSDGHHVIIVTSEAGLFAKAFDRPDLEKLMMAGKSVTIRGEMIKELAKYKIDDIMSRFQQWDMAGVRVPVTVEDVLEHPQVQHNKIIQNMEDPNFGPVMLSHPAARFSETPLKIQGRAPLHGEHTREVMQELGYSETDIDKIVMDGTVCTGGGFKLVRSKM